MKSISKKQQAIFLMKMQLLNN